jgi:hypothetical protein
VSELLSMAMSTYRRHTRLLDDDTLIRLMAGVAYHL